jgi:hypothetical protein
MIQHQSHRARIAPVSRRAAVSQLAAMIRELETRNVLTPHAADSARAKLGRG